MGALLMAGAAATFFAIIPASGQAPPAAANGKAKKGPPSGPAPRTADGKPDLNGVWGTDRPFVVDIAGALPKGETLPMQPWAEKLTKERLSKDDPEANCMPTGVPRLAPYPMKFAMTPSVFIILFEGNIHTF